MKKLLIESLCFFALGTFIFAQVNRDELELGQSENIQFANYGGPHAVIESVDAIMGIGTSLGREIAADLENYQTVQPNAKYSVHHVVGVAEGKGLDADIFILNENAGVDHITNLRRIITGYLMAAYDYSKEDAETISVFITVYNAVYRGQLSNFSEKYKPSVMAFLTEDSVGLSTNWEEWAGNTQIVIPLGTFAEGASPVETSEISDDKVIEALRSEDDKNVELREKLTDIKENEAKNADEKAKAAQKEAAQEKKEGKKAEAEKSAKTAAEQQKLADKKGDEVKSEREQLAKDKAEVKKEEIAKAEAAANQKYLTSLFVVDAKNHLYSLMTVNQNSGEIVKKSELKQIREKSIYPVTDISITNLEGETEKFNELFLAVCGVNDKRSAIKLCLIDSESLEIKKQSEETLSENSSLIEHGGLFYVIIVDGGKYYLASYDKNLSLKGKSTIAINGASPINLYSEGILVTDEKGNPVLLSLPSLNSVWQ
ncbi:MAG: hypothetical protein IJ727_01715 [Treponema sp.]|nr:hypothetical protein [Treponema sp.]